MKKNGEYVGVNEKFIPEEEKYVDESILGNNAETQEKIKGYAKKGLKTVKKIGIGYLCFLGVMFVLIIGIIIFGFTILNNARKNQDEMTSSFEQKQDEMTSLFEQKHDEMTSMSEQKQDEMISSAQQKQDEMISSAQQKQDEMISSAQQKQDEMINSD